MWFDVEDGQETMQISVKKSFIRRGIWKWKCTDHRVYKDTPSEPENSWRCDLRILFPVRTAEGVGLFGTMNWAMCQNPLLRVLELPLQETGHTLIFPLSLQDTEHRACINQLVSPSR